MVVDDLSQGTRVDATGATFRIWAPDAREVSVVFEQGNDVQTATRRAATLRVPLQQQPGGFFAARVEGIAPGARYRYLLDGRGPYPDPCARFQPDGPHGASQLVGDDAWHWTDQQWQGVRMQGQVLYEMHVGAFTSQGTFDAAADHLDTLRDLGVTLIELMPVAEFAGRHNWGYDGVALFAPFHGYGDYDALKRFVDRAHATGLGVILDVVYNHFGPDGAYACEYSRQYLTDRYKIDWGEAINFDGEQSGPVREFFISNACYWIGEFHLDGLRIDATQCLYDASPTHILSELSARARTAAGGRSIVLIAENEPQDVRCIDKAADGGYGLDAMWNDDFHHASRVALTGSREGYMRDYEGSPQEFVSTATRCFLYQGQYYAWQKQERGTQVGERPAWQFVNFIQNHDQVGNTLRGERISVHASRPQLRAMTAILLLSPQTPMLFMGQELECTRRFTFFSDHRADLAWAVRQGRQQSLGQFANFATPEAQAAIPDPSDPATFEVSKMQLPADPSADPLFRLHRDLLRLRRTMPLIAAQSRFAIEGAVLATQAFVLRWQGAEASLLLIVNLGRDVPHISGSEPLLGVRRGWRWQVHWSSEHPDYGGAGIVSPWTETGWMLPALSAVLLVETSPDH